MNTIAWLYRNIAIFPQFVKGAALKNKFQIGFSFGDSWLEILRKTSRLAKKVFWQKVACLNSQLKRPRTPGSRVRKNFLRGVNIQNRAVVRETQKHRTSQLAT